MKPYTYLIKFKPTGQCYYGSRFKNVRLGLNPEDDLMLHYTTSSNTINDLVNEHGLDAFEWEVRRTFDTPEQASDWETRVVKRCKVLESKKWLNGNIAGYIMPTEESRKKISDFHKGKAKSKEHKKNLSESQKGKPKVNSKNQTPEYRALMSQLKSGSGNGRFGKEVSEETRRRISEAKKGKQVAHNKGKSMSEEQKQKLREAMLGRKVDPEVLARRIKSQTGKKRTPEQRAKISEALKAYHQTKGTT